MLKPHEFKFHDLGEFSRITKRYSPSSSFTVFEEKEGTYITLKVRDKTFFPKAFHANWQGGCILVFLLPNYPKTYPYALPDGVRLPQNSLHQGITSILKDMFGHTFEDDKTDSLGLEQSWVWVCFHECKATHQVTPSFEDFSQGDSFSKYFLMWYRKLWDSADER